MNICLITPPSSFLLDERVFPALGILKVGAALEHAGHTVEHLDLAGVTNFEETVRTHCITTQSTVFALTATTPQIPATMKINDVIKKELPDVKTILGGPHVTLVSAAAQRATLRAVTALSLLQKEFEVIVAGDGERAILQALNTGESLVNADDPRSELWLTSQDFTDSLWPARHLIDVDSYHYEIEGEPALHTIAQLGCPFACGFCGGRESFMLRRIRLRSTENVIAELEHLHLTYGVRGMMLNDDELNVNKQMIPLMYAIRDLGRKHGFTWKLRGFVKAELFNEEQAQAMYDAGFRWLLCGFESAHPRILRNINKKATLDDNTRMLRIAHAHGLKVKALMSFGHPAESEETIYATRDWLLAERPDDFDCTVITKYPGTPYWDHAVPSGDSNEVYCYTFNGDRLYSQDVDFTRDAAYYKGVPGDYTSYVWTDYLTPERLVKLRDEVEDEVRSKLHIPYPSAPTAIQFEHSMGQLPDHILRGSS